ncbi:hypothetical protein RCL1_003768 [Eukaryota sp. TZLM3-RCL]
MSYVFHHHNTLNKLIVARENRLLTDFELTYHRSTFPCHKAVAILSDSAIGSSILRNDFLIIEEGIETSSEVIEAFVNSLYGKPLEITNSNALDVLELSRFLNISSLISLCKLSIKERDNKVFTFPFVSALHQLQNDHFRDFSLVYKNVRIKLHKFLLATLCPVFLSRFELQPGDNEWNFTNLLTVQESSFEEFFTSFYKDKITITLENLFDTSHLAFYFQMVSLESCCDSLMNSAEPLVSWIFPALKSADKADDLRFVDRLASVLVKVDDLVQSDPVAIKPDVLYKLCPNVNVFWLSTVLVHSYFHYDTSSNHHVWTPHEVQKALNQIDTNTLTINQLYTIIKPLLKVEELYSVLSEFSLTRFTIEKSEIPSEWLVWLMVELDKNEPTNELNWTTRFASLLSQVFSKAKLSIIEPLVLHPKSFNVYLGNITQQYLILWFIRSLIISWKVENHWTVHIFDEILSIVNWENVDSRELIAVLRPLETISDLFDFYCKFMTTKVTPLVIRDYAKTSEELVKKSSELSTSKQENESLKKSKEELEREKVFERKRCEELEVKGIHNQLVHNNLLSEFLTFKTSFVTLEASEKLLNRQLHAITTRCQDLEQQIKQHKDTFSKLQIEVVKYKSIVDKHALVIADEEAKQILEEQERLAPYRSNPLSFIANNPNNFFNVCGGKVKFLSDTRGSNLTLSNDDLRVEKTSRGCSNSFIAINRPPTGSIIFTANKVAISFIGVFDPSHAQGSRPFDHMSGVQVCNNGYYVRLQGMRTNETIITISRVEVEFTQSKFKITLPQANWSRDYVYEEGWVFGLSMYHHGESWTIE